MSARVSATKAAEIIGCSESFIRKLIKRGELTSAEKVGGRWSIARADLDSVTVGAPMRTVRTGEADGERTGRRAADRVLWTRIPPTPEPPPSPRC